MSVIKEKEKKIITGEDIDEENEEEQEEEEEENIDQEEDEIIDLDDAIVNETHEIEKNNDDLEKEKKQNIEPEKNPVICENIPNANTTSPKNQNVNMSTLQNIDINILPKEDVLNFLLNSNDLFFSPNNSNILLTENTMLKTKKKSIKVNSTIRKQKNKPNYMLTNDNNSAEKTYDFHTAIKKMVSNLSKTEGCDDKLIKLMLDKKVIEKSDLLETVSRYHIENKVKNFLERKSKKLDVIQEKLNENFNQSHPFCPKTNVQGKSNIGDLNEFLNGQYNHLKKVDENIKNLKEETEKKIILPTNPKIDNNSLKIFNEKIKTDDKVYERLYKKRNNKDNIFKSSETKKKHVASKSQIDSSVNNLYNQFIKKNEKLKELEQKVIEETTLQPISSLYSSNKIILIKFINEYNEVTKQYGINLNFHEIITLLGKLNLVSRRKELEDLISRLLDNKELNTILNDCKIVTEDKRLALEAFDILKNSEGTVNKENLFVFLVCVINLYEYYLLKTYNIRGDSYLKANKQKEKPQDINSSIISKKDVKESFLKEVDQEIIKKIKINKKFIGYDDDGNLCISLQMANLIHKNFSLLSINYFSKENQSPKDLYHRSTISSNPNNTFKPSTNSVSDILSSNFRRKIKNEAENMNEITVDPLNGTNRNKEKRDKNGPINAKSPRPESEEKFNLNYINLLLVLKKKKEKLMAKKKLDIENKEISECSFKPKINMEYSFSHSQNQDLNTAKNDRFDKLYKMGTNMQLNRKDRQNEEVEVEKNAKECTFKPSINITDVSFDPNMKTFEGSSYQKQFDRLKKGRLERKIREIANSREPFQAPEEIEKNLVNKKKTKNKVNFSQTNETLNHQNTSISNNEKNEIKITENSNVNQKAQVNDLIDKKEQIPLLIIDVNLRPGEKKKIYVMDGDTAEGLADKFSKEHNLDQETKNKLKILIQSHMSKLLLKIEEEKENQSVNSDISLTNNL